MFVEVVKMSTCYGKNLIDDVNDFEIVNVLIQMNLFKSEFCGFCISSDCEDDGVEVVAERRAVAVLCLDLNLVFRCLEFI